MNLASKNILALILAYACSPWTWGEESFSVIGCYEVHYLGTKPSYRSKHWVRHAVSQDLIVRQYSDDKGVTWKEDGLLKCSNSAEVPKGLLAEQQQNIKIQSLRCQYVNSPEFADYVYWFLRPPIDTLIRMKAPEWWDDESYLVKEVVENPGQIIQIPTSENLIHVTEFPDNTTQLVQHLRPQKK
jgi:hypothetical protein